MFAVWGRECSICVTQLIANITVNLLELKQAFGATLKGIDKFE